MADPVKNFGKVTLFAGYNASATVVALQTGHGAKLPDPGVSGAFNLVWWNFTDYPDPSDDPNVEIVRCTARAGDTLTITRAQESTGASTHNASGKVHKMILAFTEKTMTDLQTLITGGTFVADLSAQCNGSNKIFTVPDAYVSGSLHLTGTHFPMIYRPGVDFTETGPAQITLAAGVQAPNADDTLILQYVKA